MSEQPSLSQYFVNDPPSFFDEIAKKSEVSNQMMDNPNLNSELSLSNNPFMSDLPQTTDFFSFQREISAPPVCNIPDEIRDMWEPPYVEMGLPPQLTMPGVMSVNDLCDPVREAVLEHLGENEANTRKLISCDDVTQDERGLRNLIERECYRSAINLTSRLLTMYGQGYGKTGQPAKHTPHSLQLWFTRFALLVKLGEFDLCQAETEAFGLLNRPDIYFEFYPEMYAGRKGSMACFSFRLLLAELPLYMGSYKLAMDRLTDLLEVCMEIKNFLKKQENKNEGMIFWLKREIRILNSIITCALAMKDFNLVKNIMERLNEESNVDIIDKRALASAWGRIYLQCGYIFGAEEKFAESRKLKNNPNPDTREYIDRGLIAVAQNDFQEAFLNFQKALTMDPSNIMLYNNMGVCLLYTGKLKEAIILYEKSIASYPQKALNERFLLNLSTLYELNSNFLDKKLELLKQINKYKGDLSIGLDVCLKLQTLK